MRVIRSALIVLGLVGLATCGDADPTEFDDGTIMQTVPTTGGTIVTDGLELVIPDGSLAEATTFTIAKTTYDDPDVPIVAGTTWEIEPGGTTFDPPARLTLGYLPENVPPDFPEGSLKCFVVSGGVLELIQPTGIDEVDHRITCPLPHLSVVGVAAAGGGPIAEAIAVTDSVSVNVRSPARLSVAEAIAVTDSVSVNVRSPARPNVAEAIGVMDSVSVNVVAPVRASVAEAIGVTDSVNVTVKPGLTADLSIPVAVVSDDTVDVGQSVTYTAGVENAGPDDVTDAVARYQMFGDAVAGPLEAGCSEVAQPAAADVEIVCTVGEVAVGQTVTAPAATFVPQSAGDYAIWIDPGSSATDPNPDNDRFETTLTALETTTTNADLRLSRLTDDQDPVLAGSEVRYRVEADLFGTMDPLDGVVVNVLFTGDADLVSSASGCTSITGGVTCALGTMIPGVPTTVEFTMRLPTAGVVTAEATIVAPAGVTDTDPSNNTATETTTVEALPAGSISVGEIIEAVKPTSGDTTWYSLDLAVSQLVRFHLSLLDGDGSAQLLVKVAGADTTIYPGRLSRGNAQPGLSVNVVLALDGSTTQYTIGVTGTNSGRYRLGAGTGEGRLDQSFGNFLGGDGTPFGLSLGAKGNEFLDMAVLGDATLTLGDEALAKFDAGGALDPAFGVDGVVDLDAVLALNASSAARAFAVQPDGRIVVAARRVSPQRWVVARFDASGALDPAFGANGIVEITSFTALTTAVPTAVGVQQNGTDLDIVVSGWTHDAGDSQYQLRMIRLNPDGSIDTGFGTNGIVSEGVGPRPDGMEIQSDGRILIADSLSLRRYETDGARDATFGVDGLVDYAGQLGVTGSARGLTVLPDGDLLVVGTDMGDGFIMRLTPTGALDASFAGGGYQRYHFGHPELLHDVTLTPSGALVAVGHQRTLDGGWESLIAKMSADGAVDSVFGIVGYTIEGGWTDEARAAAFDSMGRLMVGHQQFGGDRIVLSRHLMN